MPDPSLFLGLISGTSADGIDAALVRFDDGHARLVFGRTYPWDAARAWSNSASRRRS